MISVAISSRSYRKLTGLPTPGMTDSLHVRYLRQHDTVAGQVISVQAAMNRWYGVAFGRKAAS